MKKHKILIIGAGSIGNHLAYACRQKMWDVTIHDIDKLALDRTREMIYPSRYGLWDEDIKLITEISNKDNYELIIIGTPPHTHLNIASNLIEKFNPKLMLIEKPLCQPNMNGLDELKQKIEHSDTTVLVGFNHNLTPNTKFAEKLIKDGIIGEPLSMHVQWLEHWGGIFSAHPWLSGPIDSYLGYWEKGGGSCGEHSHAISIWQHFSRLMNCGRIAEVSATMKIIEQETAVYDESSILSVKSTKGLVGTIIQDVITNPAKKNVRIQGSNGFIDWYVNYNDKNDAVLYGNDNLDEVKLFPKSRTDDFVGEIDEIELLLNGEKTKSVNCIDNAIDCMKVIYAAFQSNNEENKKILV